MQWSVTEGKICLWEATFLAYLGFDCKGKGATEDGQAS